MKATPTPNKYAFLCFIENETPYQRPYQTPCQALYQIFLTLQKLRLPKFDSHDEAQGLLLPFPSGHKLYTGILTSLLLPAIEELRSGKVPAECRMLNVQFTKVRKSEGEDVYGVKTLLLNIFQRSSEYWHQSYSDSESCFWSQTAASCRR
jgi:hypothetical protein